jgi:hypothetical protein
VKGRGLWAGSSDNGRPWDEMGTLPYTLACMVKSRPGQGRHPTSKREKEGKKELVVLPRARLSSYLYRLCVTCVHLSMLGGVSIPLRY